MYKEMIVAVVLSLFGIWDIKKRAVPTIFLVVGLLMSILCGVWECVSGCREWFSICCGILPGIVMLVVAWLTDMMGYGDGMVLILMGILYGYKACFFVLCISLFLLSIVSVILLAARKVKRNTKIPYIPFLGLACLVKWGAGFI